MTSGVAAATLIDPRLRVRHVGFGYDRADVARLVADLTEEIAQLNTRLALTSERNAELQEKLGEAHSVIDWLMAKEPERVERSRKIIEAAESEATSLIERAKQESIRVQECARIEVETMGREVHNLVSLKARSVAAIQTLSAELQRTASRDIHGTAARACDDDTLGSTTTSAPGSCKKDGPLYSDSSWGP